MGMLGSNGSKKIGVLIRAYNYDFMNDLFCAG